MKNSYLANAELKTGGKTTIIKQHGGHRRVKVSKRRE